MNPPSQDFYLSHQCEITDVNCWKNELRSKFNCKTNDLKCWKNKTDRLPCNIADVECWKK